jgi:hypothetical protein
MRGALTARSVLRVLMLTLALAAVIAPTGRADSAAEGTSEAVQPSPSAQRAAEKAAAKAAAQEERAAARKARQEERATQRVPNAKLRKALSLERTNGVLQISCTSITWTFREFPNLPGNTVTEKLKVNRVSTTTTFTFDGTGGTNVTPIDAPPGSYIIDGYAKWRRSSANGVNGGFDIHAKVTCPPRPAMSVEKLQRIAGVSDTFSSAPQTGEVGQTIVYEILVNNTGNVSLTVGPLSDERCDAGTISGGPAGGVLAPSSSSAYLCKHVITAADLTVGSYANTVTLTGTPPEGDGAPQTETSNTVVTEVKPHTDPPGNPTPTTPATTPVPAPAPTAKQGTQDPGKGGVLAFSSGTVPSLKGPRGCVRARFHARVRSAGVASVTFYLDGRKLRKLTAHSAHGGLLSITIDPTPLKLGAHRLLAKITMIKATTAAKAVLASRSMRILRCRSHVVTPRFAA